MRMASSLSSMFGVRVPLIAFFKEGTVRRMAKLIAGLQGKEGNKEENKEGDHSFAGVKLTRRQRVKEEM